MAEASAPASSANLGAGFDTLALALELRCRVVAERADDWQVDHVGDNQPEVGSQDAVLTAARRAVDGQGAIHLTVRSEIPVGRGLGSSAAAFAAGAMAAWRAIGVEPLRGRLFRLVADLEGHADNAAAAVFGGLQAVDVAGEAYRLTLHPDIFPVVAVPDAVLLTNEARAALPGSFSREVVVRSLQRAVALVEGLRLSEATLLASAGGDEIHEGPRSHLNPLAVKLIEAARSAGAGFAGWSGAGPSVIAITSDSQRTHVATAMASILDGAGVVMAPGIATTGVE
jgi:homoserine kinase